MLPLAVRFVTQTYQDDLDGGAAETAADESHAQPEQTAQPVQAGQYEPGAGQSEKQEKDDNDRFMPVQNKEGE